MEFKMGNRFLELKAVTAAAVMAVVAGTSSAAVTTFGAVGLGEERTSSADCFTGDCVVRPALAQVRQDFEDVASMAGFLLANKKYERFSTTLPMSNDPVGGIDSFSIFGGTGTLSTAETTGFLDNDTDGDPPLAGATGFAGRWDTSDNSDATWFEFYRDLTIELGGSYDAFGFYMTDQGDVPGVVVDLFLDDSTDAIRVEPTSSAQASVMFFGVYSTTAFSKVTMRISNDPFGTIEEVDFAGLDDIVVGNLTRDTGNPPLPEPGTLALIGLGLLAAARKARRSTT